MNSKERMMIAINKGVPDRLPVTLHQWQEYHLNKYMSGLDVVEASKKLGFDCSYQYLEDYGQALNIGGVESIKCSKYWHKETIIDHKDGNNVRMTHKICTPKGNLQYKTEGNLQTTWITEPMVKKKDDIELLKFMPISRLDHKAINKAYDHLGDAGILRGFIWGDQAGCWQHVCVLHGTEKMIWAAIDYPNWVHEFLRILLDKKLTWIEENMPKAKFDIVETGGGAASSTVISPKMYEEFCLPYDREINDALHRAGQLAVHHTCGGMYGLFDLIIANYTDASETLTPKIQGGNIDGYELYEAMHGKVSLIGGMAQSLLENGTTEEIQDEVYRLFEVFGQNGGYICSSCDHFFEVPVRNLVAFARAAIDCKY